MKIDSDETEIQRALICQRAAAYKKRKKEAVQQCHVMLAPVDASESATISVQPAQEQDDHAVAARPSSNTAVQKSNAAGAQQVAQHLPLHCPTIKFYLDDDTIQSVGLSNFPNFK